MSDLHNNGWLDLEQSSRLLHAIFPNYPCLSPEHRIPPKEALCPVSSAQPRHT